MMAFWRNVLKKRMATALTLQRLGWVGTASFRAGLLPFYREQCQEAAMNGLRQKNGKGSATATPDYSSIVSCPFIYGCNVQ